MIFLIGMDRFLIEKSLESVMPRQSLRDLCAPRNCSTSLPASPPIHGRGASPF